MFPSIKMSKWSLLCTLALLLSVCYAQPQAPSYKYSRAANEEAQRLKEAGVHHGHAHGGHGHSHEGHHGHSHGGHGHSHEDHDHFDGGAYKPHPGKMISSRTSEERMMLWGKAIGATLLVSLAPFFILIFIPISEKRGNEDLLKVFLAFASGGLLGDAFLHLIPHAMTPHGEGHSHSHSHEEGHSHDNSVGISVLLGILAFLMVEKFVRLVKGGHSHGHSHSHAPEGEPKEVEKKTEKKDQGKKAKAAKPKAGGDAAQVDAPKQVSEKPEPIKVGAYLNLAADFAHNFTDGLAIGASFLAGNTPGMISTVIILLHEVPHEIGDFALLVQNGMAKRRAMCVQLLTAVGCLAGTVLSLTMEGVGAANWVLPFTAGGFIYIATVSVIPELLENSRLWQSVKEVVALIVGVGMMMLLTEYE